MAEFSTNRDLLWATLNKLIRQTLDCDEHDPSFEIGGVAMNNLLLKEGSVLETVWRCSNSPGSGGLSYRASTDDIRGAYRLCLAMLKSDENLKDMSELIEEAVTKCKRIDASDYMRLLGSNQQQYTQTVTDWNENPADPNDLKELSIDEAEGKVISVSAGGHFDGKLDEGAFAVGAQIEGDVGFVEVGDEGKAGRDVWMKVSFAGTEAVDVDRSSWFDYELLDQCMRSATSKKQDDLRHYWADPVINPETGEITKSPGPFRYISSQLILWQGIKVRVGFTSGQGTKLDVHGRIQGDLSVFGINLNAHVKATGDVIYNEGGDTYTYTFDSGEFSNAPFILGVKFAEHPDPSQG